MPERLDGGEQDSSTPDNFAPWATRRRMRVLAIVSTSAWLILAILAAVGLAMGEHGQIGVLITAVIGSVVTGLFVVLALVRGKV